MNTLTPTTSEQVQEAVRTHARLVPHGARTKRPLTHVDDDTQPLDMRRLTGIIEYQPDEFTFTAYTGTPLQEIEARLAEHGQYLPFDPPFIDQGATLGGTVAAGLSGSGQKRYGGVRDFIIGVRFVDGTGQFVRGGGKVVKNAAGFDLPKLMVGSAGRLGVLIDMTFKVFPRPEAQRTLRVLCENLDDALACMAQLNRQPFDLEALDLEPPATLIVRISGNKASINAHAQRIAAFTQRQTELLSPDEATRYWQAQRDFDWAPPDHQLIKFVLTLRDVPRFEQALTSHEGPRRYGVAGNVAWVAWPTNERVPELPVAGLAVRGELNGTSPRIGHLSDKASPFARRIKQALDPQSRFPTLI